MPVLPCRVAGGCRAAFAFHEAEALISRTSRQALGQDEAGSRCRSLSGNAIGHRVGNPGLGETLEPQLAAIALTARDIRRERVVAAERHAVIDAEFRAAPDDVGLVHRDQWAVDFKALP